MKKPLSGKPVVRISRDSTPKKPKEKIIVHPTEDDIREAVLVFGRMNPPTIGHQRLIEYGKALSEGSDFKVFLSHRQDSNNPLGYEDKLQIAKDLFGDCIQESECRTIFECLQSLSGQYDKVTILSGSDRVDEWRERVLIYQNDLYEFASIEFKSLLREGINLEDTAAASTVREMIDEGDETFIGLLPDQISEEAVNKLLEVKRADYVMVKTFTADGKPIWRKQKRELGKDKEEQPYNMSIDEADEDEEVKKPRRFIMPRKEKQRRAIEDDG